MQGEFCVRLDMRIVGRTLQDLDIGRFAKQGDLSAVGCNCTAVMYRNPDSGSLAIVELSVAVLVV